MIIQDTANMKKLESYVNGAQFFWGRVMSMFYVKMLQINYGPMVIMHTIIVVFCKQQLERFLQSFLTTRRELLGMKLLTSWVCDSLIPARLYLQ